MNSFGLPDSLAAPLNARLLSVGRRLDRASDRWIALGVASAGTLALDWGRMILLAAPVFYPAAAHVLSQRGRWRAPVLLGFLVLAIGYAVYIDVSGVQTGIIDNPAPPYPVQ